MISSVAPYIGKYKKYTVIASFLTTLGIVANVVPYFFLYQLIVPLTQHQLPDFKFVVTRVILIFVCLAIYAIAYSRGLAFSHISAYNTLKNIRISLKGKLENQPLGNIKELGTGQIKRVFTDDIDQIELLLAHAIPEGIANLTVPIIVILGMFVADWRLALLTLATIPLGSIGMFMMLKAGNALMGAYYESAKKMNNTIIEYVNGMKAIKVFNKDGDSFNRFGEAVKGYRDFTLAWYKVCWPWMAVYNSTLPCLALFTLPIGGILVLNGTINLSQLILVLCMSFAVGPAILRALCFGGKIPQLNYKIAELEKLMNGEPIKAGENEFSGKNYDIEFNNVHFSYKKELSHGFETSNDVSEKNKNDFTLAKSNPCVNEVLHGINLTMKQGTTTALIGESGSGKSTLAKLLVHFYDVDSGSIKIGGQDITDMTIESLNNQISYVAQEQFLFNTSLYENILIGRPTATREEVLDAAHRAQCDEFLARFPKGIDTMAGDSGKQLSGGERQRISLARAILKNAPVIVLDEATASVDADNEHFIQEAISELCRGKTLIVIAHRLNTIRNASRILVIKEGQIVESGTHDELMAQGGQYKNMVERQNS